MKMILNEYNDLSSSMLKGATFELTKDLLIGIKKAQIVIEKYGIQSDMDFSALVTDSLITLYQSKGLVTEDEYAEYKYLNSVIGIESDDLWTLNNNRDEVFSQSTKVLEVLISTIELYEGYVEENLVELLTRLLIVATLAVEDGTQTKLDFIAQMFNLSSVDYDKSNAADLFNRQWLDLFLPYNISINIPSNFSYRVIDEESEDDFHEVFSAVKSNSKNKNYEDIINEIGDFDSFETSIYIAKLVGSINMPDGLDHDNPIVNKAVHDLLASQMEYNDFKYEVYKENKNIIVYKTVDLVDRTIAYFSTLNGIYFIQIKYDTDDEEQLLDVNKILMSLNYTLSNDIIDKSNESDELGVVDINDDIISKLFVHDLDDYHKIEVNILLQKLFPNIVIKLEKPTDEIEDEFLNCGFAEANYFISEDLEEKIVEVLVKLYPRELFIHVRENGIRYYYHNSSIPIAKDFGPENNEHFRKEEGVDLKELQKIKYDNKLNGIILEDYDSISTSNVIKVSNGLFHEVTLFEDGTVLGRGSNYWGQIELSSITKKIKDIYCGKLFTVVHYFDNTVESFGVVPNISSHNREDQFTFFNVNSYNSNLYESFGLIVHKDFDYNSDYEAVFTAPIEINYNWDFHGYTWGDETNFIEIKFEDTTERWSGPKLERRIELYSMEFLIFKLLHKIFIGYESDVIYISPKNYKYMVEGAYIDPCKYWGEVAHIEGSYDGFIASDKEGNIYIDGMLS